MTEEGVKWSENIVVGFNPKKTPANAKSSRMWFNMHNGKALNSQE